MKLEQESSDVRKQRAALRVVANDECVPFAAASSAESLEREDNNGLIALNKPHPVSKQNQSPQSNTEDFFLHLVSPNEYELPYFPYFAFLNESYFTASLAFSLSFIEIPFF